MRRIILVAVLLLAAFALLPAAPVVIDVTVHGKNREIPLKLEVVATPSLREKGLMYRDHIGDYDGMMFLFPERAELAFWMKNTQIPLDMLFIDGDKIIHIEPDVPPYTLDPRRSGGKADVVIELDAGRAAREGITAGDSIDYTLPTDLRIR